MFSSLFVSGSHGVDAVSSPGIGLSVEEWGWVGAGWGRGQGSRHWGLWSELGWGWGHEVGVWVRRDDEGMQWMCGSGGECGGESECVWMGGGV